MAADVHKPMVRLAWVLYIPMIAAIAFVREPGTVRITDWRRLAVGLATSALLGIGVIAFSRHASRRTAWGRALFQEFRTILAGLSSPQILVLSLLSAFGEEILFRGVIHPRLGLWATALLFAGFHFPFRRRLMPWTLFAGVLGVGLGLLTDGFASLWPAILFHFLVNYFNLHDLAERDPPGETPPAESS